MASGQAKSAESRAEKSAESSTESSAGSSTGSMGRQEETRTSRDAGPYLARRVSAGGWRVGVGGLYG